MSIKGSIICGRYAFMPNRLAYCGPDKNHDLFEYTAYCRYDQGLNEILGGFETMYPYLAFIASENGLGDPFDQRVVEAYWLGNNLLRKVSLERFYWHLADRHHLKKKLNLPDWRQLTTKIPRGAKPNHAFHVLNIFRRTGHIALKHTLPTMENCRISWGQVVKIDHITVTVKKPALIIRSNKLALGPAKAVKTNAYLNCLTFVPDLKIGDFVTLHWGWLCDKINQRQVLNLQYWTKHHIALANLNFG